MGNAWNARRMGHVFWLTAIGLVATGGVAAQTVAPRSDTGELIRNIDAMLDAQFPAHQPGAAVVVVQGGREIYRSARGRASLELGVPLHPEHVFRLGSITKQFTAAAIMLLVEEGKIDLTDEITKFLPDYPTQGAAITVEHLLNHTSGIRSYTELPGWMINRIREELTVAELIDGFKNEPMDFQPGEQFRYNNSGYILLGAIIEQVTDKTYAKFLQERILGPLQMTETRYGDHAAIIANRTPGYDGSPDDPQNAQYLSMTQPYAAGSLLSTVGDLGKWNRALFGGRVVSPESLAKMTTSSRLNDGSPTGYGFGLVPGDIRGHRAISHGGGIFGFSTFGVYLPDDDIYVAVLCNSAGHNPTLTGTRIAALTAGDPFPEFQAITLDPAVLQRYVGVYRIDDQSRRLVTVEDGQLYTMRNGGNRLAALPSSETAFFYEASPSHFEFVIDADHRVTGMRMYQGGGNSFELAAKVDEAMPKSRTVADIDFSVCDDYVGEFELAPGFAITIRRDGQHLYARATGQPELEVLPASETTFFPREVDAEITFVRDPDGSVNQLVLAQGARRTPGLRKKQALGRSSRRPAAFFRLSR